MAGKCDQRNPLSRSGTHQLERAAAALDPDSTPIDERSTADLLVFAQRYSRHLRFYDATNTVDGDWLPFFGKDESAILALLGNLPFTSFLDFSRTLREWLIADGGRPEAQLASHLKLLFHLPLILLQETGEHFDRLPLGHPLREFVVKAVTRDGETPLRDLIAYAKGAASLGLYTDVALDASDYNTTFNDVDARVQLPGVVTARLDGGTTLENLPISTTLLSGIEPGGWSVLHAAIAADVTPYGDNTGVYDDIRDALGYGSFTKAFERLFQTIQRIAIEAGSALAASLEADDHTPHYGLWLAFLQLFAESRSHLNMLTGRHLDFYYEDVLQLASRAAEADQVHLLFELNKNVDDHLLRDGTRFKAGKDDDGKPVVYALDSDLVVNRAKVQELRALRLSSVDLGGASGLQPFAAIVANSADGRGEALPKDDAAWRPFGPLTGAPAARVGFAVADPRLFLREGARTVFVTAYFPDDAGAAYKAYPDAFKVSLSTEDGWLELGGSEKLYVWRYLTVLQFQITLDGEDPAIIPFDPEIHGDEFDVSTPVLKIEYAFDADDPTAAAAYADLADLTFTTLEVSAYVSGARNFTLQNELGVIDASKPFLPFGPTPTENSSLILGSSELFGKRLDYLSLKIEWDEALNDTDFFTLDEPTDFKVKVRHLTGGAWSSLQSSEAELFDSNTTKTITLQDLSDLSVATVQTIENELYTTTSRAGFIRFDLQQDFGHAQHTDVKTLALIAQSSWFTDWELDATNYNHDDTLPFEPYTPTINEISLTYYTERDAPASFFHLHPFGPTDAGDSSRLFPALAHEGELYIGIVDLAPPQRLTLLFQTVDGTSNPLKDETAVEWHYLQGNEWKAFEGQDVDDKTNNLTGTGIVGLAVPDAADTEHDVLPSGLHWFRLSIVSDADAMNDLLSIDAQSAIATYDDDENDPAFVATPLPAATISKLETSDSALKKIVQPAESFGGRAEETDDEFYVRVSERLRHKDRASTMWDYERLVLEAFPSVYKVKCVNHTELCRDSDSEIVADNELKPGHVLVVPVPYVSSDGPIDPLRPYTDTKTLVAVAEFLNERTSPFVQLEVQNPRVEEVQVDFRVAFKPEIADISFYLNELNDAIVRYLTPWSYEEGAEISFGGTWYKSAIINFVEEQPYVDYVKDFAMYHKRDIEQPDAEWAKVDVEVIQATTARSILVSHATHVVEEVS